MNPAPLLFLLFALTAHAELRVPAFTAYTDPDPNAARVSERSGLSGWAEKGQEVSWFGDLKTPGKLAVALAIKLPSGSTTKLRLTVAGQSREVSAAGTGEIANVSFGEFNIGKAGYTRFELSSLSGSGGDLDALILDGPALAEAQFNLKPRRNAASVHLNYPTPKDAPIDAFYNEVTAVEDPVTTFYMACGFHRGYFGMQVNSATERRIIFSVWDAGSGQNANNRESVAAENHTSLLAKGEGVTASVFGGEGTGGHSHLSYAWKTGEKQRFFLTAKPHDTETDYAGYYFHPEQKKWMLIASFRAPKDGRWLHGLHSFSENFGGSNGHLRRKALYGPQWYRTADGLWHEIASASFSHDGTGKADRLDRCTGVENGRFFLAHGGFLPGFTKYGETFTRPPSGTPPTIQLPEAIVPR
jgi:hypothetical protein